MLVGFPPFPFTQENQREVNYISLKFAAKPILHYAIQIE